MGGKKRASLPAVAGGTDVQGVFSGKSGRYDLTYRRIAGLTLTDRSLESSLFTGAIFEGCHFERVKFDRSDFAGTKFADCTFENCSIDSVEMRSCFMKRCVFRASNLKRSEWALSHVEATQFDACDFDEASVREATFLETKFVKCRFPKCSVVLDRFKECLFDEIDLSDCTALFLFFDSCEVRACRMSAESVGYTYGLTEENLNALDLSYLGEPLTKPTDGPLVDNLLNNYIKRHWYVGACALELNFNLQSPAISLRLLVERLSPEITAHRRVEWDELQFLSVILQRLKDDGRLPLVGIWPLYQLVQNAYSALQEEFPASQSFAPAPELVLRRLGQLLDDSVGYVSQFLATAGKTKGAVDVELRFMNQPAADLKELLPAKLLAVCGASRRELQLLSASSGSWIEYWQLGLAALAAFQVALVSVQGVVKGLRETGEEAKGLVALARPTKKSKKQASDVARGTKSKELRPKLQNRPAKSLMTQKQMIAANIPQIPDEYLRRLDEIVLVLLRLSLDRMRAFDDYSPPKLQAIKVQPFQRRSRRGGR